MVINWVKKIDGKDNIVADDFNNAFESVEGSFDDVNKSIDDVNKSIDDVAVQFGESNVRYTEPCFTTGTGNQAGTRGFRIIGYNGIHGGEGDYSIDADWQHIQKLTELIKSSVEPIKITILNKMNADSFCEIKDIEYNEYYDESGNPHLVTYLIVDNFYSNSKDESYNSTKTYSKTGSEYSYAPELGWTIQAREGLITGENVSDWENQACLYICGYPEIGSFEWFKNASCFGKDNISQSVGAFAVGVDNKSFGKYSTNHGVSNKAGYDCHNFGRNNDNSYAQESVAFGYNNIVTNFASRVFQFGDKLLSKFPWQFQIGKHNENKEQNLIEVGFGEDNDNRENIAELDINGNQTLKGKLTIGAEPESDMDVVNKGKIYKTLSNMTTYYTDRTHNKGDIIPGESYVLGIATADDIVGVPQNVVPPKYMWHFKNIKDENVSDYISSLTNTNVTYNEDYISFNPTVDKSDCFTVLKTPLIYNGECNKFAIKYRARYSLDVLNNESNQQMAIFFNVLGTYYHTIIDVEPIAYADDWRVAVLDLPYNELSNVLENAIVSEVRIDYYNVRQTLETTDYMDIAWFGMFNLTATDNIERIDVNYNPDWKKLDLLTESRFIYNYKQKIDKQLAELEERIAALEGN